MSRGNSLIAGVVLVGLLGSLAVVLQASDPSIGATPRVAVDVLSQVSATAVPLQQTECAPGFDHYVRLKDKTPQTTCKRMLKQCPDPKTSSKTSGSTASGTCTPEKGSLSYQKPATSAAQAAAQWECEKREGQVFHCIPSGFGGTGEGRCPITYQASENGDCCKTVQQCRDKMGKNVPFTPAGVAGKGLGQLRADALTENDKELADASLKEAQKYQTLGTGFTGPYNKAFQDADESLYQQSGEQQKLRDDAEQEKINVCSQAGQSSQACIDAQADYEKQKKAYDDTEATRKRLHDAQSDLAAGPAPDADKEKEGTTGCKTPPCTTPDTKVPPDTKAPPDTNKGPGNQGPGNQGPGTFQGQPPPNQQPCSGISQTLGLCQNNSQQQSQNYCVRSYNPPIIDYRPATPGCLNYNQQQQQCGLIQQVVSGCPQPQNPYGQQCRPQYYCMNNTLYWGSPQGQGQQTSPYGYDQYGYGSQYGSSYGQSCQNQMVQQCQYGCAQPTQGGLSTQCAPNPQQSGTTPTATISCGNQTQVDIGAAVSINFSCTNAVSSTGSGFSTGGALSGTASTTIQKPPAGTDTVSYGLTCTAANNQTATNKCDLKINVVTIIMVANPKEVEKGKTSTLGWVTRGMEQCVISSTDTALASWNDEQKNNKSVSGTAKTPSLTNDTEFLLSCLTTTAQTKEAKVTVKVKQ